jgi:spore maturation protein CgeB
MLALPHSLKDGESVVFFHSMQDLQEIAMYYLQNPQERMAIARRGWEIAMTEHRSWHRLEEMLFGQGLTKTTVEESWFVSN